MVVSGATVRRSVLSPGVHLHSYAEVEDSILCTASTSAARAVVRRAILDKNVRVPRARRSASTPRRDRERGSRSPPAASSSIGKGDAWWSDVKVALLTREYPPEVYGGAGVHVEYLARELARLRGR